MLHLACSGFFAFTRALHISVTETKKRRNTSTAIYSGPCVFIGSHPHVPSELNKIREYINNAGFIHIDTHLY